MILNTDNEVYRKYAKDGSVLKGLRISRGGGKGLVAGGITLFIFAGVLALLFGAMGSFGGALFFIVLFGVPGLLLLGIGIPMKNKRNNGWLEFYKEDTGFSEEELAQVDRELMSPNVQIIGYVLSGGSKKHPTIACLITDHYFVTEHGYVRRIADMLTSVYSEVTPGGADIFGILFLSKQDKDIDFTTFGAASDKKRALCMEIIQALHARNPQILRTRKVACEGKMYDVMKDGKEIKRLCLEGHQFMETVR